MSATWALGTLHTTIFTIVLLFLIYRGGGLGVSLANLNTLLGFAIFGWLWATTTFTTGRALGDATRDGGLQLMGPALRWGAVNGVLFLVAIAAALIANGAGGFLVALGLAVPFALVIGGAVGVVLSVIDGLAFLAVGRILRI